MRPHRRRPLLLPPETQYGSAVLQITPVITLMLAQIPLVFGLNIPIFEFVGPPRLRTLNESISFRLLEAIVEKTLNVHDVDQEARWVFAEPDGHGVVV